MMIVLTVDKIEGYPQEKSLQTDDISTKSKMI